MTAPPSCHPVRPVRVIHLVAHFGPAGTELGIAKIANALSRERIHTSVCSSIPVPPRRPSLASDVPLYELNRKPGHDLGLVTQLYRLLRTKRPDIVHTHGWGTLCEGLVAARLAHVPAVIHGEHGTMELRRRNRFVQRWAWNRVSQLVSVSSRLADRMSRTIGIPRHRIRVIRNGVDIARFATIDRDEARHALALQPHELAIGSVGRFQPVKDHRNLLRASAALSRRGVPHLVLLAGIGPLQADLEREASELGISGQVRFLGHRPDVERVLAAFDVFTLPSKSEGLSNTILEAMAAGQPVVATDVGGASELVIDGQTGLLVPPEDSDALAAAVATLAADPGRRRRMGEAGQQRARNEFSLDRMVASYETLYLDVAGQGRAS